MLVSCSKGITSFTLQCLLLTALCSVNSSGSNEMLAGQHSPRLRSPLRSLGITFQENKGQFAKQYAYGCRQDDNLLLFGNNSLRIVSGPNAHSSGVEIRWQDTLSPAPQGFDATEGLSHYYLGARQATWISEVRSFSRIRYADLYPGIDLVFYGNSDELEFDFVVSPGADPSRIKLSLSMSEDKLPHKYIIEETGDIILTLGTGALRLRKPLVYQAMPEGNRQIEASFKPAGEELIRFEIAEYDRTVGLVIDPVISYSTFLGGTNSDIGYGIATDAEGNVYVTGLTQSASFHLVNPAQQVLAGAWDAYVVKLNPAGTSIVYSTYLGGSSIDEGFGIAVDTEGNAYVTGKTNSTDFPRKNPLRDKSGGGYDCFVSKLGPTGTLLFSTYYGGRGIDEANAIDVDSAGNPVITGKTTSVDFPTLNPLPVSPILGGSYDAFVTKLKSDGSAALFSTFLGGSGEDVGQAVRVDSKGAVYVGGFTASTNFPVEKAYQEARKAGYDAFAAKIGAAGNTLLFSTYLGGSRNDKVYGLAVDAGGDLVIAGETDSTDFPTASGYQGRPGNDAGVTDAFVTRLSASGSSLVFSTYLGGSSFDQAKSVAIDQEGNCLIAGATASPNFPVAGTLVAKGIGYDAFVAKLDPTGAWMLYSTFLGGAGAEVGHAIAVSPSGDAFITGYVEHASFPTTAGSYQPGLGGTGMFRSNTAAASWTPVVEGLDNRNIISVCIDKQGFVYAGAYGGGVFKIKEDASSWEFLGLAAYPIVALSVNPDDGQKMLAAYDGGGTTFGVPISTDGGLTWENVSSGLGNCPGTALARDPADPSRVYLATKTMGVFISGNGGETWVSANAGLTGDALKAYSIAISPSSPSVIYLGTLAGVMKSVNRGDQWTPTSLSVHVDPTYFVKEIWSLAVDPTNPEIAYAGATGLVLKTTDGGTVWKADQMIQGQVMALAVDPNNPTTLYAGVPGRGVLRSTNGAVGPTAWYPSNTGLANFDVRSILVDPVNSNRIWAGTYSGPDAFITKISPTEVFYFAQVGNGLVGEIAFQTTLILVNVGEDTAVRLEFFDSNGAPMELKLPSYPVSSQLDIALKRGEAFSAQTTGTGSLKLGYARVTTAGRVGGVAVFTRRDAKTGVTLYEAGVPASRTLARFAVLVDSLGTRDNGIALVNAGPNVVGSGGKANVDLTLFGTVVNEVATAAIELDQGAHSARYVSELFTDPPGVAGDMQGVIIVDSDKPLAAVTLRQTDDPNRPFPAGVPTLTSFPVLPMSGNSETFYFPQVGDGIAGDTRIQTSFCLANLGTKPRDVVIDFFDSAGEPMNLILGSFGPRPNFTLRLGPGQSYYAQTPGTGNLKVGYGRVKADPSISGTAVFTRSGVAGEVVYYEAGVPASQGMTDFTLFHDSLGSKDTGLAIVNTTSLDAQVKLTLHDRSFNQKASITVPLPASGHLAQFIQELFGGVSEAGEMEGIVTVESTQPLAAVTLRQNEDSTKVFPSSVPTLAPFPVIRGRAQN